MSITIPKKLMIINDMAGLGRCSMTVALPVVSACKVQACPVPTSIFSNHLGFSTHFKKDLTDCMEEYFEHWDLLNIPFDGIYCGFLGDSLQMDIVSHYIRKQSLQNPASLILIDPVMGDHGKRYRTITEDFVNQMKQFIQYATIITPNITEACLLTDTPYKEEGWTSHELEELCQKLCLLGVKNVLITGKKEGDFFSNYVYEDGNGYSYSAPVCGESRPGTGDIFASIIAALSLRNYPLFESVQIASDFIAKCTFASAQAQVPVKEGVIFENFLQELTVC